jgi:cytochrome b6-f complex iron-sulfur subunit
MNDAKREILLHHDPSRRRVINWMLGTTAGAFLLSVLYPIARYLVPPRLAESSASTVTLAMKTEDVKANTGQIFKFGNKPALLVRTAGGEMRAFFATCTHLNCTVQYRPDLERIWCACHNGHYDLNGKNVAGPPPRPLDALVVNVRGSQITVTKGA